MMIVGHYATLRVFVAAVLIRKRGIDVSLVLPMPELGRAYEECWGTRVSLYGWIDRGDNVIRFIGPEVA